jgi:hypothetical protein
MNTSGVDGDYHPPGNIARSHSARSSGAAVADRRIILAPSDDQKYVSMQKKVKSCIQVASY